MSDLEIKKITDRAGTGSPNFTNGVKVSGTDSGLLAPTRTEGETQPDAETASNGDTFYDTANDTYDILTEGAWTRVIGEGGGGLDLSNFTYDSVSFALGSTATSPLGLTFNTDGTKLYIADNGSDSIKQYSLSTGFDLSTATTSGVVSFSVASQTAVPVNLEFNNDGTKFYILENTSKAYLQYSCSTAFDISTASYDNVSFSPSDPSDPTAFTFNLDGTKMYIADRSNELIHQYTLSTAYNVSTASYDSVTLDINDPEGTSLNPSPTSIEFNSDGTKFFWVGTTGDIIFQYSLSTAYDLSTATYDSLSLDISSQDTTPREIAFNADDTKMFFLGASNDTVYQYSTGL